MPETSSSSKKFEEALHLLNEAARDKKDEIGQLLTEKYSHIREAFEDTLDDKKKAFNRFRKTAEQAVEEGSERVKEVASELDEQVHRNPWAYIGGVAVGALLLGYVLGANKRQ